MSNMPAKAIQAAVVPAPGHAQDQLAEVGQHLIEAERRSFYNPDTDTNFRAAQTALQNGRYDQLVADLNRVQTQLESAPYWDAPDRRPLVIGVRRINIRRSNPAAPAMCTEGAAYL